MSRLQRCLLTAPWWQHSAIFAVVIGTVSTLLNRFGPSSAGWPEAALYGALAGLLTGAVLGPLTAWSTRRARKATGDLTTEQFVRSSDAVRRGSAPTDPTIRLAA